MPKRLLVIDGGDQGEAFLLPEEGTILIGGSRKHSDICLHDLYVARVHCQVEVAADGVTVSDRETPTGTQVNGNKVVRQELRPGDVIRVGNSHLRLEEAEEFPEEEEDEAGAVPVASSKGAASAPRPPEEPGKLPYLSADKLGELTGHTLGHFEIGAVLAHGHYGSVFRARDTKGDQDVALKVLPPIFPTGAEEMRRFVAVIKPVLFLQHPNLVALRGVGKTGLYVWLAKDLVEGENLLPLIAQARTARKIKWRSAVRVGLHIARALQLLHQKRLVHANITPANVLVQVQGGQAQLNDLGLWEGLEGTALQQQRLERKLLAELPYLSPEHIDPSARVDDLSDQYSLGAVVYALLTGRPPCEGRTLEETLTQIRDVPPARPKDAQRSLPDELQAVVLRMLAKRPEERYPGPGPLVADLGKIAASGSPDS